MDKNSFFNITAEAFKLHEAKSGDYGSETQYFPFGDTSYIQMMYVKTLRMVQLYQSGEEPAFESVRDTALDLLNYTVFFIKHLDDQNEQV